MSPWPAALLSFSSVQALSSLQPTRREWSAEGLLLGCALSTHPVTLNRWKILWPWRCVRSSCGICRDIFSATRPSCGRSSHPHVLSSLGFQSGASVAKLNIDSALMAQHRPPHQRVISGKTCCLLWEVVFSDAGSLFPSGWRLAACCSPPWNETRAVNWLCIVTVGMLCEHSPLWFCSPTSTCRQHRHKTFIHKQRDVYGAARWEVYPSEIEAVGISPASVYVWIAKYVPLNKFQQIFCWDLFLLLHKLYTDTHEIQQTFFIKCTIRNFFETV